MNSQTTPPDESDEMKLKAFRLDREAWAQIEKFLQDHGNPEPLIHHAHIIGRLNCLPWNIENYRRRAELSTKRRETCRRQLHALEKAIKNLSLDTKEHLARFYPKEDAHDWNETIMELEAWGDTAHEISIWFEPKSGQSRGKGRTGTPEKRQFFEVAAWAFVALGFEEIGTSNESSFADWIRLLRSLIPLNFEIRTFESLTEAVIGKKPEARTSYIEQEQERIRRRANSVRKWQSAGKS